MRAVSKHQRRLDAMMRLRRMRRVGRRYHRPVMSWVVWAIASLFVLFQFSIQLSSGQMISGLMHSFSLNALGASVLVSTYYYVYLVLQVPAGIVMDRFCPRKVLAVGALFCAAGLWVFGSAHGVVLASLGRILTGAGAAFAFVGSLTIIAHWFPVKRFAVMVGVAETIGMVGAVFGSFLLASYVAHVGWRATMLTGAIAGVVIASLIACVVRDTPQPLLAPKSSRPRGSFRRDLIDMMRHKVAWMNGLYSGLMFSVVCVFVALWGVPFFEKADSLSMLHSTLACNMVFLGVAIGSPVVGWLDQRVSRRMLMTVFPLISALTLGLAIAIIHLSLSVLIILMLIVGVSCSVYVLPFAIAHEISSPSNRSAYMGFTNMLGMISAPIVSPLVGGIMLLAATGFYHHGYHDYSVFDFQVALMTIPFLSVLAAVLVRWLPQRGDAQAGNKPVVVDMPLRDQPAAA